MIFLLLEVLKLIPFENPFLKDHHKYILFQFFLLNLSKEIYLIFLLEVFYVLEFQYQLYFHTILYNILKLSQFGK